MLLKLNPMKNLTYILIFFLVIPFTGFTQNDSIALNDKQQAAFKNQIDLDFQVLAFSLSYKHKISKNWLIGPSIGLGPVASFGYIHSEYGDVGYGIFIKELMHIAIVTKKYTKINKLSIEFDPRLSVTGWDEGRTFFLLSIGGGIYYGGKVQIGVRTRIGRFYVGSSDLFLSNSLILRLPRKW